MRGAADEAGDVQRRDVALRVDELVRVVDRLAADREAVSEGAVTVEVEVVRPVQDPSREGAVDVRECAARLVEVDVDVLGLELDDRDACERTGEVSRLQ